MKFSKLSIDSRNYLYVRLFPKVVSFFSIPIILRLITPKYWGEIALMLGLQSLISAVFLRGRASAAERYILPLGSKRGYKFFIRTNSILIRNFIFIILALEVLNYFDLLIFFDIPYGLPFRFSVAASLLLSFNTLFNSLLRALDKSAVVLRGTNYLAILTPVIQILLVALIIYFEGFNDRMIVTAYFLGQCLALGLVVIYLYRKIIDSLIVKDSEEKSLVDNQKISKFVNYSFLFYIFAALLDWQDRYFLNFFLNQSIVGYYDAIYRYVTMIGVVVGAFVWALSPTLNEKIYIENEEYYQKLGTLSLLGFLLAGLGVYVADTVAPILLPGKYVNSLYIVPVLALAIAIWNCGSVLTLIFKVRENQKISAIGILIAAIVNGILNYFFIPSYGVLGAAFALLLSCCVFFLYCNYYAIKHNFHFQDEKYEILLSCLLILLKYFLWSNVIYPIFISLIISSIFIYRIYVVTMKLFGDINKAA